MTTKELIEICGSHPQLILAYFCAIPLFVFVLAMLHGSDRASRSPWKYCYSATIYLSCIPGMFSATITAYNLFFNRSDLLDADILVYFLPLVSMVITLALIRREVNFEEIPGFDRILGLVTVLGITFGLALAIEKTFIAVWFFSSFWMLLSLLAGLFGLLQWGSHTLFRKRSDPRRKRPGLLE